MIKQENVSLKVQSTFVIWTLNLNHMSDTLVAHSLPHMMRFRLIKMALVTFMTFTLFRAVCSDEIYYKVVNMPVSENSIGLPPL